VLGAGALRAAEVKVLATRSQAAFLEGTLEGISVDPLGVLRLAQRAERAATIEEPFLLSLAPLPDGWVVGTGNAGRVIRVAANGSTQTLFETEEPEVFAVWADPQGTVWAGSSPNGKLYRYRDGEVEAVWTPEDTYIWQILGDGNGGLLVATGTEGKLYAVDTEGEARLLYDADDTHIRSLAPPLADGRVLFGTAGKGLVLAVAADGSARTLFDAPAPEVVAFASDGADGVYFAALASEASFVDLSRAKANGGNNGNGNGNGNGQNNGNGNGNGNGDVDVSGSAEVPASGSRPAGYKGARSRIFRWSPSVGTSNVWDFADETVHSLLWHEGRLWVGTGLEGKLYSLQNDQMILEKDVDEAQIVGLVPHSDGPAFATTNGSTLYRFTGGSESEGRLTSKVLDSQLTSEFGTLHWRGDTPPGTAVGFSARAGMSAMPDATWSEWTELRSGTEISLRDLDRSRYLQWRIELEGADGASPEVRSVEVSYLQANQRPSVKRFEAMPPGQVVVPGNFNPSNQVYEPAHPTRDGIFTTLEPQQNTSERNLKTLWKLGYRTLRWQVTDPNDDKLSYRLELRRESDPEGWIEIADDLERARYSFDATVLPDGHYRFRLTASDRPANLASDSLEASRVSELVTVDHSPPRLESTRRDGNELVITLADEHSILRESVTSSNAATWQEAAVEDGLLDARRETLRVPLPEETNLLLLRLTDAAFNVITYDLSEHLP
jgi:hypothetical protein